MGVHPKYGYSGSLPMKDTSVDVLEPLSTSSSIIPLNLLIEERKPQDSPTETKLIRFATVKEEDAYYHQKIQDLYMTKKELFARDQDRLATKKRPRGPSTDHEYEKKKAKKMGSGLVTKNEITQELERLIARELNGLDAKVVIQKRLSCSDLKGSQNRLNMPIKQLVTHDFLTAEEKKALLQDGKNLSVGLVGPSLKLYEKPMVLRAWSMARTKNYVLKTNWNSFVKDNKEYLQENSMIQVWSFRKDRQLCFGLVGVDGPDDVA